MKEQHCRRRLEQALRKALSAVSGNPATDVTEMERLRKASADDHAKANVKLTALSFVIKAVSLALRQHPAIARAP